MWKFQRVYPQRLLRQVLAPPVRVRLRLGSPGVEMHWEEHLGQRHPRASASTSRHSEEYIRTIMDLGVTREVAISTLDAAGGNIDVAASLLF